jgi:hypothetical protein
MKTEFLSVMLLMRSLVEDSVINGTRRERRRDKSRRLDQVEVNDGKVKNVYETTSPSEAKRTRKKQQVGNGDAIMEKEGNYIKGNNGKKYQLNQEQKHK